MNQRIAFQNDPLIASWAAKTVPREPKTPSRRLKSPPRPSKEGPRAPKSGPRPPQDDPRPPPGALLGRSWSHLGTNQSQDRNQDDSRRFRVNWCKLFEEILGSKMTPKTTPRRPQNESKIKTKNGSLFYRSWTRLGPVLRPSWAHLGVKKVALALRFPMLFEHRHFRTNDGSRRIFGPT